MNLYRFIWMMAGFLVFWYPQGISAQTNEGLVEGYVILPGGDSLRGWLKPVREDRPGRMVNFFETPESEARKYTPKTCKSFGYGEIRYESGMVEEREEFLRLDMDGEIQLLIFSQREKKGGGYVTERRTFVRLKSSTRPFEITKGNFRKEMPIHVGDHPDLRRRIRDKELSYEHLGAVIEEYNEWIKAGKPRTAWETENGNYTLTPRDSDPDFVKTPRQEQEQLMSRWAVEMPLNMSFGFLSTDHQINGLFPLSSPGPTLYTGLGMRHRLGTDFSFRFGLTYSQKNLKTEYGLQDTSGMSYGAVENWNLRMLGSYAMLEYLSGHFFMAGGLHVGFLAMPSGNLEVRDPGNQVIIDKSISLDYQNPSSSFLFRSMPVQVDLMFSTGLAFYAKKFVFKPGIQYGIPLQNLFQFRNDPEASPLLLPYQSFSTRAFSFQLGLVVEFGL